MQRFGETNAVPSATRLVTAEKREDDAEITLRPLALCDFTGQEAVCKNLRVFIEAARARREALDHILLAGPPGLGKTTLAQIIARELGASFHATSGPVIAKAGDLAAQLTGLEERDVLFIDEIHRLNPAIEEILYPAMEDYELDLIIGEGPGARSIKVPLKPFTLIGATTRAGLLTPPLRDRFGIPLRLDMMDRRYLGIIALSCNGGPAGIETIAAALSEPRDAIEDIIEPFLIQRGFVQRTPRGRVLTPHAFRHLGLAEPAPGRTQLPLFGEDEEA